MVLDGTQAISEQDKRIAGIAHEAGKAIIVIVNKWDAVEKDSSTVNKLNAKIKTEFFFGLRTYSLCFSKDRPEVNRIFELISLVMNNYTFRVKTSLLNDLIEEAVAIAEPPSIKVES